MNANSYTRHSVRLLATGVLVVGVAALTAAATSTNAAYHAVLKKSWPAAHDTVPASPDSLKLWFSEKVEVPLTKIALVSMGNPKKLSDPAFLGAGDDAPIVLAVTEKLAPGSYTVNWTAAGKDGHASKGTYDFVVKAGK